MKYPVRQILKELPKERLILGKQRENQEESLHRKIILALTKPNKLLHPLPNKNRMLVKSQGKYKTKLPSDISITTHTLSLWRNVCGIELQTLTSPAVALKGLAGTCALPCSLSQRLHHEFTSLRLFDFRTSFIYACGCRQR